MKRFSKLLLLTILVWSSLSCQTLMRSGGAIIGGGALALVNPVAAPAGVVGGIAAVDLVLQEDEIEEKEEQIKALTMGDVEGVVNKTKGHIFEEVYNLLKLIGLGVGLFFLAQFLWTNKRKKYAEKYYSVVDELKEKLEK